MMSNPSESESRISLNEDRLLDDDTKPISIHLERSLTHIYLPGEFIQGTVYLKPLPMGTPRGIDIVLTCTFKSRKTRPKKKQSLFKCIIQPDWSSDDPYKASFSFEIPDNIPSYFKDESIDGQIEYKIKAFYEMTDLPTSLYPKISIPVLIHARISKDDPKYKTPTINEKEMNMIVPRDIFLPQKKLRKGEQCRVSAKVCIPQTCFLPGDSIPFILDIQHIAPIKQNLGIQVELERIISIRSENIQSVHNTVVEKQLLPLICDTDTLASSTSSKMPKIPLKIPPTIISCENVPITIEYRMRIMINMDMQHLSEDVPVRKRDRAYSVVTKVMWPLEEEDGPTFYYGSTISMELPIVIGTTQGVCTPTSQKSPTLNHNLTGRRSLPSCIMTNSAAAGGGGGGGGGGGFDFLLLPSSPPPPPHINIMSPNTYITKEEKYNTIFHQQPQGHGQEKSRHLNRFDSDPISRYSTNNHNNHNNNNSNNNGNMILEPTHLYELSRTGDIVRPPSAPPLQDLIHSTGSDDYTRESLELQSPPPYFEGPTTPDTMSTCTN